jgi:hypothetical protein
LQRKADQPGAVDVYTKVRKIFEAAFARAKVVCDVFASRLLLGNRWLLLSKSRA